MKNDNHISPDDLFREQLNGMEVPYDEAAWTNMAALLDKTPSKKPFFWWFYKNKKNTFITLISIAMLTTTIIMLMNLSMNTNPIENAEKINTGNHEIRPSYSGELDAQSKLANPNKPAFSDQNTPASENYIYQNIPAHASKNFQLKEQIKSDNYPNTDGAKINVEGDVNPNPVANTDQNADDNGDVKSADKSTDNTVNNTDANTPTPPVDAEKTTVVATATNIVKTTGFVHDGIYAQKTTVKKPEPKLLPVTSLGKIDGPFRGPWIGIHFTAQQPQSIELKDDTRQNAGFNFQIMSHKLVTPGPFAAYVGFDFGAMWTGRGAKSGVALDNSNQDSGFTRLSNHSFDFFARGHFEYTQFRLKPYINVFAGPRVFGTSQYTEAYRHKTDYENSSNNNAYTSASWMYGAGVGARLRISKYTSLDVRYEFMQGTETSLVDVDKSTFNGLTYNLSKIRVAPQYTQLKFGFLFDLGAEEETVHKDEQEEVTEYYKYDSTTQNFVKVNCSCKQWTVSDTSGQDSVIVIKKRSWNNYPYSPGLYPGTGGSRGGSGWPSGSGGGSTRGGFPGIKPGGGSIKPKS